MNITKPFRLLNRVGQVIASGKELAVFDVSNVWAYKHNMERGRVKGTTIRVERNAGDLMWRIISC